MIPIVSVLMTTYNRERYVGEAIQSVLDSTYSNFELIVVDDQSTDNTVAIANKYADKDSRVKIYVNDVNLGDYPNRNKAASYATGKYLKYVDADDYIYPWGLQLLVEMMDEFPDAGWGLCSFPQAFDKPYPIILQPLEAYNYHYNYSPIFSRSPLSSIIKKDVFHLVGGFRPIRMAGDFDMWHRLANRFPLVLMPDGIIWNRIHAEQEMSSYNKYIQVYEKIKIEHLTSKSCPLDRQFKVKFLIDQRNRTIKGAIKRIILFDLKGAIGYFKRITPYYHINYKKII